MNKINIQSHDLHAEKLKALQSAMPQLFSEDGVLDTKELELLSKGYPSHSAGKYEFNWAGKMSAKRNAYKPSRANLKPDKARSIDFDSTENLIIEGDNLEVLKLLQKSYSNKVKCIYIDPPYNTGNDFVYTDDFSEDKKAYWEKSGTTDNGVKVDSNTESQGRYHSNWLNMMYPRLVLARELLKEDGVIFVSIDDNEFHNLRKIMDEVLGEENFVEQLIWKKRATPPNDREIGRNHEYILLYGKDINKTSLFLQPRDEKSLSQYTNPDNDIRGPWRMGDLSANGKGGRMTPSTVFKIENPETGESFLPPKNKCWLYNTEKVKKFIDEGRIGFRQNSGTPFLKRYLSEVRNGVTLPTIMLNAGYSQDSAKEINEILGHNVFEFSKPSSLIQKILTSSTSNEDIVLDFFAGSGTTAHAVMELNKEDGGNRKYILVQLPELTDENSEAHKAGFKTISDITIERVKRVSEKIQKEDEGKLLKEGKHLDLGFKVFKLAPSFFPENQFTPNPEKTEEENLQDLNEYLEKAKSQMKFEFDEEELMFEIILKDGFKLNFSKEQIKEIGKNKVYKITDGEKVALICLDDSIDDSTLKILEEMNDMRFICLERAVDTTKKWNLKSIFGQNLWVA